MGGPAQHDPNPIGYGTIWARHGLARSANRAMPCRHAVPPPQPRHDTTGARSCRAGTTARSARANRAAPYPSPTAARRPAGRRPRVAAAGRPRVRLRTLHMPGASRRPSPAHVRAPLSGRPQPAAAHPPTASARRPSPAPTAAASWPSCARERVESVAAEWMESEEEIGIGDLGLSGEVWAIHGPNCSRHRLLMGQIVPDTKLVVPDRVRPVSRVVSSSALWVGD